MMIQNIKLLITLALGQFFNNFFAIEKKRIALTKKIQHHFS